MARPNNGPKLAQNERGFYEIRWSENGRSKRVSTGCDTLPQAQQFLAGWITESQRTATSAKCQQSATLSDVLDFYMEHYAEENAIAYERQAQAIKVLKVGFGDISPSDITDATIAKYKKARKSGVVNGRVVSDSTLRRELNCLLAACRYAAKNRRISADSIPNIVLPPSAPPKDIWLDEKEEQAFWDLAAATSGERLSRIHRFVAIALETAARRNAIESLRWDQIDLEAGVIHYGAGEQRQKNKRRVPVPISDRLRPVLERAYAERVNEYVLGSDRPSYYLFVELCEQAALKISPKFFNVTPHTLRHTWATLAARAGVDLFSIAGVLGDSMQTVMRNYAHHSPDHLRSAINFRAK